MKYNPSFNKDLNRNTWDFSQVNTVTSDTPKEKICNSFCYWPRLVFFVDAKELDAKCAWFSIGCTLWCLKKMKRKFKIIFRSQEVEKDVTPSVVSVERKEENRIPNEKSAEFLWNIWREVGTREVKIDPLAVFEISNPDLRIPRPDALPSSFKPWVGSYVTRISCILLRSEICRLLLTSQYLLWRGWQSEPALVLQLYPDLLILLVYKKYVHLLNKLCHFTRISSPEESCRSLTSSISCWLVTRLSRHQVRLMNEWQSVHHFHILIKSTFLVSKGLLRLYNNKKKLYTVPGRYGISLLVSDSASHSLDI